MNIKEFAQDFIDSVKTSAEIVEKDYDLELASAILEYITDSGEVNAPELCYFQKTRSRITAYDFNDEAESLDLFYLIKADTLIGKINNGKIEGGFNYLQSFYREAINDSLLRGKNISITEEISEVITLIKSTIGQISQLRLYVMTDGLTDPVFALPTVEQEEWGITIEFNVWDMQRIYQQDNLRRGKEKIEIDFQINYNTKIPCLKMNEEGSPFVDAYLAIIPGDILAKIYKRYQQTLLEKNVRTFLQFKGKVNKGIRRTIQKEPEMFFSYNNGISTTASEITIKSEGRSLFITHLYNWQIVNGGQTTASLAATLSESDLTKVFVPMKVSVINSKENEDEIVKKISTYANSQTSIRNSDYSANEKYLTDLENFSRKEWVPNGTNTPIHKWYFERTRGQYFDQLAQLNGYDEKRFRIEYPKHQKITKTDLAKYEVAWNQCPSNVCKGAEKNYELFISEISKEKPTISSLYYKELIAKCILFNEIDECVKSRNLGGHKSKMNAYILSSISFLSGTKLDLLYIWNNQKIQEEIHNKITELIDPVWNILTEGLKNSGDWAKDTECWNKLKKELEHIEKIPNHLLQTDEPEVPPFRNPAQAELIEKANSFSPEFWFTLAEWAKSNNLLTPLERKQAFNRGQMRGRSKLIEKLDIAQEAIRIIEKAREAGFDK